VATSAKDRCGFEKGQLVYRIETWGNSAGRPNESQLYQIRSIGKKQAILDRVDKTTLQKNGWRGHSIYLTEEPRAREHMDRYPSNRHNYPWRWDMALVPASQAGWDPEFNPGGVK